MATVAYIHGDNGMFYVEFKIFGLPQSVKIKRCDITTAHGITDKHMELAKDTAIKTLYNVLEEQRAGPHDAEIVFRDEQAKIKP